MARYVRELVGDDGRRIADFMVAVLEDESERTEVRMEAARWLADRGFGRAVQPLRAGEEPRDVVIYESTVLDVLRSADNQQAQLTATTT